MHTEKCGTLRQKLYNCSVVGSPDDKLKNRSEMNLQQGPNEVYLCRRWANAMKARITTQEVILMLWSVTLEHYPSPHI